MTSKEEIDNDDLSPTDEQKAALELDRHVAITAGAGTGKTFTLTERYLRILESTDATPEAIVTITFTNDAANELQERIRSATGEKLDAATTQESYQHWRQVKDELEDGYVHTIHGFCARLLREYIVDAPVQPEFEVYDEADADALGKRVVRQTIGDCLALDDATVPPHSVSEASVAVGEVRTAIKRLTRLWGRDTLESVLLGLLQERPASADWAARWAGATQEEYMDFVWGTVHPITTDKAQQFLADPALQEALETIQSLKADGVLADISPTEDYGAETVAEICALLSKYDILNGDGDDRTQQQFIDELCSYLTTKNGDRDGRAYIYRGSENRWEDADRAEAQAQLEAAVDTIFEVIEPEEQTFGIDDDTERISGAYVTALATLFTVVLDAYERAKDRQNILDYADLIQAAITLVAENPEIQRKLQAQFSYIMVDEMQDTDRRQWRLISLIAGLDDDVVTDREPSHVFIVGDEKQSIYRFRGADVTTFGAARDDLDHASQPAATGLELSGSFRTIDSTLTFCNELFEHVFEPLGDQRTSYEARPQELSPERTVGTDVTGSCEYLFVPADDHPQLHDDGYLSATPTFAAPGDREAYAVAARLTRLFADPPTIYDDADDEYRAAKPRDVTILLRSRTHLDSYERALDRFDIPYSVAGGTGYYDTPEITTLVNLLKVLEAPSEEIPLYGVLRSPLFGFTDETLAKLRLVADDLWTALETVATASTAVTFDQPVGDAYRLLQDWRRLAGTSTDEQTHSTTPWGTLLSTIIADTGFLASIAGDERPRQAAANVNRFREQLRQWEEAGIKTISELLARIERARELGGHTGNATIPDTSEGVQIRTIHSAKGLEFPIVVVPELGTEFNFQADIDGNGKVYFEELTYPGVETRLPGVGINSPTSADAFADEQTLVRSVTKALADERERAELKRLLYVALTRARDHLLLSGTHELEDGDADSWLTDPNDPAAARCWLDWLQPILLDDTVVSDLQDTGVTTRQLDTAEYTVQTPVAPVDGWAQDSPTDEVPLAITLPVAPPSPQSTTTTATEYAKTAREAVTTTKADKPATQGSDQTGVSATTFGTIVHRLCEHRPPQEQWAPYARSLATRNGESIDNATLERLRTHTNRAIQFVDQYTTPLDVSSRHDEFGVIARFERDRVIGEIDHLVITDDAFHVIDYKTNDLSNQSIEDLVDQYRRQLEVYATALHQSVPEKPVHAVLYFTDTATKREFIWEPSQLAEIQATVKRQVRAD